MNLSLGLPLIQSWVKGRKKVFFFNDATKETFTKCQKGLSFINI